MRAGQPTPYQILLECLKRNAAYLDATLKSDIRPIKHKQHEYKMIVGEHQVRVVCGNKREGKQKAAQSMLEKLHPHIKTWGSLIRLYGYGAQRKMEDRSKDHEVVNLQNVKEAVTGGSGSKHSKKDDHGAPSAPNKAILDKLRSEMKKLHNEWQKPAPPAIDRTAPSAMDRPAPATTDRPSTSGIGADGRKT